MALSIALVEPRIVNLEKRADDGEVHHGILSVHGAELVPKRLLVGMQEPQIRHLPRLGQP
jgi:hypothetical protein